MVKAIRSRSRKINFKSRIAVRTGTHDFGEEQALDYDDVQEPGQQQQEKPDRMETGVDKEEESELHLQNAISAAQAALVARSGVHQTRSSAATSGPVASSSKAALLPHIPTPDATGLVEDYDQLYSSDCYVDPKTYIRFSDTVEDATGVAYCMDEDDEDWLNQFNTDPKHKVNGDASHRHSKTSPGRKDKGKDAAATGPLSEADFELIMDHFEKVTEEKLPTLHADTSKMPSYVDFEPTFADSPNGQRLQTLRPLAKFVFEYWTTRRLERSGKNIMPLLDHDESREDNPYVCFRRRDPKNVRKTRRTESQNLDRLVRLSTDLQAAYELIIKVLDRERLKKENLVQDRAVFEGRVQLRDLKRKAGEKTGDDDILITRKEKRRRPEDLQPLAGASSSGHRIPIRIPPRQSVVESLPVGHTVPAVPVVDQPAWLSIEHANALLQRIEKEAAKKKELDRDWEDFTDGAFHPSPLPKPAQYWRSPDALPLGTGDVGTDRQTVRVFERQRSDAAGCSRPSFRRRVGRGGRVMLDRIGGERQRSRSETSHTHGLRSDRWKFDCDALELPLLQAPDILDDIELKHQVSRLGLYQPGDFTSLHVNPQHLHDSQKWINRPEDTPPPTQVVGRIPYRQAPPQPPVQPIAQQHQVSQAGPLPPGTGSMPGQLPMLPPSSNPLMALKRAPSHSGVGGSPQMPNGSPIPNGAMPQPPPGPRRMPSNHLLQQMPNSQMMAQWQSSNGMINTSKMDPATLQNLSSQIAQAQQNGMLATPRLPTQFPNGAPRMPAGYPNASPSGPFSDPSATGRPPSASPNQNQRSQMMPPQAQPQAA